MGLINSEILVFADLNVTKADTTLLTGRHAFSGGPHPVSVGCFMLRPESPRQHETPSDGGSSVF